MAFFASGPVLASMAGATRVIGAYVTPVMTVLGGFAAVAAALLLAYGGIRYMTSSGSPERLDEAKRVIRNALIGLGVVIAAGTLVAVLAHAYGSPAASGGAKLPALVSVQPAPTTNGLVNALIDAVTGLFRVLIDQAAQPFLSALAYFTDGTPLMASNGSVFSLWLATVAIADGLFVLVTACLGFHIMSYEMFGTTELEFKHMLPRLALVFAAVNTSIFAIDAVIGLSNVMISAVRQAFPGVSVWQSLSTVVSAKGDVSLAALLIMVAFLVLSVMLMVYYVMRLVALFIGAVLAPIVILLWLVPGFKSFAEAAAKVYASTIFVLFVHVVILELAASLLSGMAASSPDHTLNPLMSMIVGVATVLALLKTQGFMNQLSYVSLGPQTAAKLGGLFMNAFSYYAGKSAGATSNPASERTSRRGVWPDFGFEPSPAPTLALVPVPQTTRPGTARSGRPSSGGNVPEEGETA